MYSFSKWLRFVSQDWKIENFYLLFMSDGKFINYLSWLSVKEYDLSGTSNLSFLVGANILNISFIFYDFYLFSCDTKI